MVSPSAPTAAAWPVLSAACSCWVFLEQEVLRGGLLPTPLKQAVDLANLTRNPWWLSQLKDP